MSVHIQPGASKSEIAGLHGEAVKIRIKARPVEGAANAALMEFVADWLGVRKSAVTIVSGEKARHKRVQVAGLTVEAVRRKL